MFLKLGIIGLVEEEWISTLATVDAEDVEFLDFVEEGRNLALELKSLVVILCNKQHDCLFLKIVSECLFVIVKLLSDYEPTIWHPASKSKIGTRMWSLNVLIRTI